MNSPVTAAVACGEDQNQAVLGGVRTRQEQQRGRGVNTRLRGPRAQAWACRSCVLRLDALQLGSAHVGRHGAFCFASPATTAGTAATRTSVRIVGMVRIWMQGEASVRLEHQSQGRGD